MGTATVTCVWQKTAVSPRTGSVVASFWKRSFTHRESQGSGPDDALLFFSKFVTAQGSCVCRCAVIVWTLKNRWRRTRILLLHKRNSFNEHKINFPSLWKKRAVRNQPDYEYLNSFVSSLETVLQLVLRRKNSRCCVFQKYVECGIYPKKKKRKKTLWPQNIFLWVLLQMEWLGSLWH